MAAIWELWLTDNTGNVRLALLDMFLSFQYVRVQNEVGAWFVELPGDFDEKLIAVDGRVEFWRGLGSGTLSLDYVGFIRRHRIELGDNGLETLTISGPDAEEPLARRR